MREFVAAGLRAERNLWLRCVISASIVRRRMLRVNPPTGQELREERVGRHLSQIEAAAEVGVSYRTWQIWETSDRVVPQPRHRRALIDWFNGVDEDAA